MLVDAQPVRLRTRVRFPPPPLQLFSGQLSKLESERPSGAVRFQRPVRGGWLYRDLHNDVPRSGHRPLHDERRPALDARAADRPAHDPDRRDPAAGEGQGARVGSGCLALVLRSGSEWMQRRFEPPAAPYGKAHYGLAYEGEVRDHTLSE